jgi:hypothetical protein
LEQPQERGTNYFLNKDRHLIEPRLELHIDSNATIGRDLNEDTKIETSVSKSSDTREAQSTMIERNRKQIER